MSLWQLCHGCVLKDDTGRLGSTALSVKPETFFLLRFFDRFGFNIL